MISESQAGTSTTPTSPPSGPSAPSDTGSAQASPTWNTQVDRAHIISQEIGVQRGQVERTLELLDGGATLPFIARYRKEATGGLDEVQIGTIKERGTYLAELVARKETILAEIHKQGKLAPGLRGQILKTLSKTELEDLYLPYKPKRRTRATIAREKGLQPLADRILQQEPGPGGQAFRDELARPFLSDEKGLGDTEAVFAGARDIVAEAVADTAEVRAGLRGLAMENGLMRSRAVPQQAPEDEDDGPAPGNEKEPGQMRSPPRKKEEKEDPAAKYSDYFDYEEAVKSIPSHRMLALRRGEKEGFLKVTLEVDRDAAVDLVRRHVVRTGQSALRTDLELAVVDGWDRLLKPAIEVDVRLALRERADAEAIRVFAENLRHLLLAPVLGGKRVLALDPGYRTGCKLAIIDEKGDLKGHDVVYPTLSEAKRAEAAVKLEQLAKEHKIQAIAIGNGTAGRETEGFVRRLAAGGRLSGVLVAVVNEAGASVYSASEIARQELPDVDLTVRGAVSIGRRLQDPLAELVKIDAKSIGVGQYQHDVHQPTLKKQLDQVVESCVNQVGVDVNTASQCLLQYVAGVGETLAKNIIQYRAEHGRFGSRQELLQVPRMGPKSFEQSAGFLRITESPQNPLDRSAVHPESYDVVERMARDLGVEVGGLLNNRALLDRVEIARYVDERRGEPTLRDILKELEKPGRDPRAEFEEVGFNPNVTEFEHVKEGMVLSGVVTNVTAFGAFVDIGVHQDGLVHVSELAHHFVKDPGEVAKVGDKVKVRVVKLDLERRRIGLSIKGATEAPKSAPGAGAGPGERRDRPAQSDRGDRRQGEGRPQPAMRKGEGRGPVGGAGKAPPAAARDRGPVDRGRPKDEEPAAGGGGKERPRGDKPAVPAGNPFSTPFNQIRIRTK